MSVTLSLLSSKSSRHPQAVSDMRIMQLGWVYDVNFTATLKRLKKRKLIKGMADFLPNTDSIEPVKNKILKYVDSVIEKNEVEIMN